MPPNTPTQPISTPAPNPPAPTSADIVNKLPASAQKVLNKNSLWIIIALALVSIFSVTFGIYQMIENSHAKERVSSLESELEEKNKLIVQYGAALGLDVSQSNKPGNSGKPSEDKTETKPSLIASKDYIYIGEWGIKIKIPKNLRITSFEYNNYIWPDSNEWQQSISLCGLPKDTTTIPEFANPLSPNHAELGILGRYEKGEIEQILTSPPTKVYEDDEYEYGYSRPQDVLSIDEAEQELEVESTNLIEKMLTNPANYSKF